MRTVVLGGLSGIRTLNLFRAADFLTTPYYYGRDMRCSLDFTFAMSNDLGARRQVSTRSFIRLRSVLSYKEFHRIWRDSHRKFPILVLKILKSAMYAIISINRPKQPQSGIKINAAETL